MADTRLREMAAAGTLPAGVPAPASAGYPDDESDGGSYFAAPDPEPQGGSDSD